MKKIMTLAAVAALVLSACAKIETETAKTEPEAICFGVYTPKAVSTKVGGQAGTQTNLTLGKSDGAGFGVYAFYSDNSTNGATNDYNPASSNFTPNFMWNTNVKGNGDGSDPADAWTYSPIKYWPNEYVASVTDQGIDKITFFAYAPWVSADKSTGKVGSETEGITTLSNNDTTGDPTLTFVVPASAADQVDVLYADKTNLMNLTKPASNAPVQFTFKHALTSIAFRVQTFINGVNDTANLTDEGAAVDGATTVTLKEVYFGGASVYPSGTLNIATGVWTPAAAGTKTFSKTGLTQTVTKTKADVADFGPIMIIPKEAATSYDVRVVYTVETTDSDLKTGKSTVNNDIKKTLNLSLQAGKKNTIDLVLGLYTVEMTATVSNWETADPQEVDLPQNN